MGWYGFNGGSTLAIVGYSGLAAHVMVTTTIAASAGCLSCAFIGYAFSHIIDPANVNNGVLAGLVAVTSSCATCSLWGAFIIGLLAGSIYFFGSKFVANVLKLDDVVDAIAVHGFCGAFGAIAPALFSTPYYYGFAYYADRKTRCAGVFYGGNPSGSLKAAVVSVLVIFSWVATTMSIVFGILRLLNLHRVSAEVERMGMDHSKHGGRCVKRFSIGDNDLKENHLQPASPPNPKDCKTHPEEEQP